MLYAFLFFPCMLHAMSISSSLIWSFYLYLAKSINYEAPNCAVSSNLLSFCPSSQIPLVFVLPLMSETKFYTHKKPQKKLYFCIFLDTGWEDKFQNWMAASITRIQFPLNILMKEILIRCCRSKIIKLCHYFKSSVSYLHVMIFPCIPVTRQQHTVKRRGVISRVDLGLDDWIY
jgi:hypothetical protein